jgi:hypothetical protein
MRIGGRASTTARIASVIIMAVGGASASGCCGFLSFGLERSYPASTTRRVELLDPQIAQAAQTGADGTLDPATRGRVCSHASGDVTVSSCRAVSVEFPSFPGTLVLCERRNNPEAYYRSVPEDVFTAADKDTNTSDEKYAEHYARLCGANRGGYDSRHDRWSRAPPPPPSPAASDRFVVCEYAKPAGCRTSVP